MSQRGYQEGYGPKYFKENQTQLQEKKREWNKKNPEKYAKHKDKSAKHQKYEYHKRKIRLIFSKITRYGMRHYLERDNGFSRITRHGMRHYLVKQ